MKKLPFLYAGLVIAPLVAIPGIANSASPVEANDFINVFQEIFGERKGFRKAHAKGICAAGEFVPSQEGMKHFNVDLLSGGKLPVIYRFSVSGGNPEAPDNYRSIRGMAAQVTLKDGSKHIVAMNTSPMFSAKDAETFLGLLKAGLPGPNGKPDPEKVKAFREAHPETKLLANWLAETPPPYSYNNARYHGLHTFFVTGKSGENVKVRWHLEPKDGVKGLSAEEISRKNYSFLNDRLKERLSSGAAEFDWVASLGKKEDTETDPSLQWPSDRAKVILGTFRIISSGDQECQSVNFDPNMLSKGFTGSDDSVLKMRGPAYAISFAKRLSGQ